MFRVHLLSFALALSTLGSLTVFRSPAWSPWKLAVLAGEFGHWLALLALTVALGAWSIGEDMPLTALLTFILCAGATVVLMKPAVQAWRLGVRLPEKFASQFRPPAEVRPAFTWFTLYFGRDPTPVAPQTLEFAPDLPLDFYPPVRQVDATGAPCIIVIHAGGWDSGDRKQLPKLNHWLSHRGYAVAAISYRLAPKAVWPAQRDDVLAAIAFLKSRAAALGIDSTRLVLLGRSAGGQIAQTVGYTAGDPAIRGVVGLYAPSDLIFGYLSTHENDILKSPTLLRQFLGGTPESARANYESASAINHVNRQTPPTLLLHGTNDALAWHRHSELLDARLAQHGVPRVYVELPWATHAFDFNLHGPGGQLTTFSLEWFLAAVTADSPPRQAPAEIVTY